MENPIQSIPIQSITSNTDKNKKQQQKQRKWGRRWKKTAAVVIKETWKAVCGEVKQQRRKVLGSCGACLLWRRRPPLGVSSLESQKPALRVGPYSFLTGLSCEKRNRGRGDWNTREAQWEWAVGDSSLFTPTTTRFLRCLVYLAPTFTSKRGLTPSSALIHSRSQPPLAV